MLPKKRRKFHLRDGIGDELRHVIEHGFLGCLDPEAVDTEKTQRRLKSYRFVAISKRVVL